MKTINLKEIKKGDIFYERGGLDWYKLIALEDGHFKGTIDITGKTYDQYQVKVINEFDERINILVTEGLPQYNGKYYTNGND
jgi:hypothetical protein